MATSEQRRALLAVGCPWCSAAPGEECAIQVGRDRRLVTTLDGNAHDARWRKALDMPAPVLTAAVEQHHAIRERVDDDREPVSVGSAMPEFSDRPW